MPIIDIRLIPSDTDPEVLKQLVLDLFECVASITELGLTNRDTTVLLTPDLLKWGIGSELIVFVHGLFQKPERTPEVVNRLTETIGKRVEVFARDHVPHCSKVEVLPPLLVRQADGFWAASLPGSHPLDE